MFEEDVSISELFLLDFIHKNAASSGYMPVSRQETVQCTVMV
jgi:hypothetical protein